MSTILYPQNNPFHLITGELLPDYRDAYLLGRLTPTVALQVEQYLGKSSIQTSMALARYHELSEAAQLNGHTVTAPRWVQQQLLLQPLMSTASPLRRPVVRVALGLFLALSVASGVQWMRNEPLLPAPVTAAVTRVAASVSQATQTLVKQFTAPQAVKEVRATAANQRATAAPKAAASSPRPQIVTETAIPARAPALVTEPADSLAKALPTELRAADATPAAAPAAPAAALAAPRTVPAAGTVRGYIRDSQGRPLAGATVLVKNTLQGTSTDATGQYTLEVPAGATIQFGYAGYNDLLRSATLGTMNVVLEPSATMSKRAAR